MEVDVRRFLFACLGEDPSLLGDSHQIGNSIRSSGLVASAPPILTAPEGHDPGFLLPLKKMDRGDTSDDVYSIPVHGIEFYPSQAAARKKLGQLPPSEYPAIPPELAYGAPDTERALGCLLAARSWFTSRPPREFFALLRWTALIMTTFWTDEGERRARACRHVHACEHAK